MTLDQFVALHNGKSLDYDGKFGPQCVDEIDYYMRDVLGFPIVWANAIDWFGKDQPWLTWVANTPTNVPPKGAIIVWRQDFKVGTGIYGHIAIAYQDIGVMQFTSFDQNWGSPFCKLVRHTYEGVIGWGIPNHAPPPTPAPLPGPGSGAGTEGPFEFFFGWVSLVWRWLNGH